MNIAYNPRTSAFISRTTTLFTKNVNTPYGVCNNKTVLENGTGNVLIDANFLKLLNELLSLYSAYANGDYQTLNTTLTNQYFFTLSTSLGNLKSTNPIYKLLQSSIMYSLQGLQRAYVQYIMLENTTQLYDIAKDRAAILDNMDRLREFIEQLNTRTRSSIFGDYSISTSVSATIAPEYLIYIQQYGYPLDGVFDVVKLSQIVVP